jgi:hypothetical protein
MDPKKPSNAHKGAKYLANLTILGLKLRTGVMEGSRHKWVDFGWQVRPENRPVKVTSGSYPIGVLD